MRSRGQVALLGVALAALAVIVAACGGGSLGPTVKDASALVKLLDQRRLPCVNVQAFPPANAGETGRISCSVQQPRPKIRDVAKNPASAMRRLENVARGPVLITAYRDEKAATTAHGPIAKYQCTFEPDSPVSLSYQVQGPNWIMITSDGKVAASVAGALGARVVDIDC